jgi:hypothetical protein
MQTKPWWIYIPVALVWAISLLAGFSYLRQAADMKTSLPRKGWRKWLDEIRFRLVFAAGSALLLWVLSGLAWLFLIQK